MNYIARSQLVFDGIVKNLKFLGADGQILTAGKSGKIPPGQIRRNGTGSTPEKFQYFYHPDHLGSTSYVTDASGEVYQHLEYFAFGETFVEEHLNTDRTPYLFNGKELDEETGLYYYGARYYDARASVWLSVDPLAMKFPNISPYAFSANNPINFVDPDGRASEATNGTDPVFAPRIRPTGGELNKSRFQRVNRINPDGSIRQHHGIDILAPKGTSLKSALAGEVVSVRNTFKAGQYARNSYGNFIIVKSEVDGEPVFMKYAHLDQVNVKVDDQVSAGTAIGLTGNTGNAVGLSDDQDHVHIEASKGGDYFNLKTLINPEQFFETKFDSQGNPIKPNTLTDSEVSDISNFTNDFTNEQNFIDPSLPGPVSLPELE